MRYHERPFKLREIKIEVTHKCPMACIHCSSDATPLCQREMTKDKCFEIINQAIEMGVEEVSFSGGEPLIWPWIAEAIKSASEGNMKVAIYTTGYVDMIDTLYTTLKECGLKKAIFSVYGPSELIHERVTRLAGSFNKTLQSMEYAHEAGIETEVHFVAMSKNYRYLKDIVELVVKYGITRVSVLRFVPQGRGALLSASSLDKKQNLDLKKTIIQLRKEGYDVRTGSPFNVFMINSQPACYSGIDRVIISPDLRIYPCDAFKQIMAEELVGTLSLSSLDGATLDDCWQQSPYLEAVREYLTTDFAEPCKACNMLEDCLSGCLAQKVITYGGLQKKPDPACLMDKQYLL